jgi:DNA-binding LacI/PurR family transcriptional regulator
VYFTLDDKDLIKLIKKLKQTPYKLGKDVGIISYNDTMLKEILEGGITTISTDFKFMGSHLAKMLKENVFDQIENPKKIILRNSL